MSHAEPVHSSLATDPVLGGIVALFVSEMPARIETLETQSARRDWEELRRTAHQLKGALGSHGFHQLTPVARQLETEIQESQPEMEILNTAERLIEMCRRLSAEPAEVTDSADGKAIL